LTGLVYTEHNLEGLSFE